MRIPGLAIVKALKVDHDFAPCPANIGDELFPNGIFEFNITKIVEFIHNNPEIVSLEEVAVSNFSSSFSSIDESQLDSVEISVPVILADISPGNYNLIDGCEGIFTETKILPLKLRKAFTRTIEEK